MKTFMLFSHLLHRISYFEDRLTDNHIKSIVDLLAEMYQVALNKKDKIKLPFIKEKDEVS